MVRLKELTEVFWTEENGSFNSKMVRLKEAMRMIDEEKKDAFQFQNGAIKS